MKIVFEGSELKEGLIKVSLDGGFTFEDYEISNVKESGIPLDDSQRYDKIKIKGPANVLKSLDIVSNVKVQGEQSSESSDYDTRIEWYSWKSDDGEIIFTKTDDKTQDCIIYEKQPVDKEGHYDYFEVPLGSRTTFSWTDDGIVKSWAGSPGIQTYLYSRFPIGDVVIKEPKERTFYSWVILEGRVTESDGSLINKGTYSGTLYTTKNPETEEGPFIFYSISDNDEVSIEFIQKNVDREFPATEFKGQYCIYTGVDTCIMFNGGLGKQLKLEMTSVPVEAIRKGSNNVDETIPLNTETFLENINANTNYIISLIVKNGDSIRVIKEKAKSTYYYEDIQQGFRINTKNLEIYAAAGGVIDQESMTMYGQCSGGKVLCGDEWKTFIREEFEHRINQEANVEIISFDIQEV